MTVPVQVPALGTAVLIATCDPSHTSGLLPMTLSSIPPLSFLQPLPYTLYQISLNSMTSFSLIFAWLPKHKLNRNDSSGHANTEARKLMRLQSQIKNSRQLRNDGGGEKMSPPGKSSPQLILQCQGVIPEVIYNSFDVKHVLCTWASGLDLSWYS